MRRSNCALSLGNRRPPKFGNRRSRISSGKIPASKWSREIGPQSSTQLHDLLTQKLRNRDTRLDVFVMDVIWPAEFASAGWALPLDRYLGAAERQKFLAAPLSANEYRGQLFGLPLFIDAGLLYYRKDLLEKYRLQPPRTWPQLVEHAKTILAHEKDPRLVGFSAQFKQYEGLVCNMMEYIRRQRRRAVGRSEHDERPPPTGRAGSGALRARSNCRRDRPSRRARLRRARVARALHAGTGDFSPQLALRLGGRQRSSRNRKSPAGSA